MLNKPSEGTPQTPVNKNEKNETLPGADKTGEKPGFFNRVYGKLENGMKVVGKSVSGIIKATDNFISRIPIAGDVYGLGKDIIRTADGVVSQLPIAGEVYGLGKNIISTTWGVTEEIPLVGEVMYGLRDGATSVADNMGFTGGELGQMRLGQERLRLGQRTPNDLQTMLDNTSEIGGGKRDILQNIIEMHTIKGETVSREDFNTFQEMVKDAQKKQEYAGGLMLGSLAEASWDVPGGKTSDWVDSSGQRQTTQFSSHPLSGDEYKTLISSNPKFPAPAYEALSDRQKRFLDTCKTQICPNGSPTKEQKELIGAMAYVSEAFGKNENESVALMNARMQEVKNTYGSTMPDNFRTIFDQAMSRGKSTNSLLAKEGYKKT